MLMNLFILLFGWQFYFTHLVCSIPNPLQYENMVSTSMFCCFYGAITCKSETCTITCIIYYYLTHTRIYEYAPWREIAYSTRNKKIYMRWFIFFIYCILCIQNYIAKNFINTLLQYKIVFNKAIIFL